MDPNNQKQTVDAEQSSEPQCDSQDRTPPKEPDDDFVLPTILTNPDYINDDAALAFQLAEEESVEQLDCDSDAALAMLLQNQFDSEYDAELRSATQPKVSVCLNDLAHEKSLNSSDRVLEGLDDNMEDLSLDDEDDEDDVDESDVVDAEAIPAWDVFEQSEIKTRSRMMGRSGFVLDESGNIITKHDIPTSSRKNMCRLMELKTDIQTGDAGAIKDDFKITNYVYNHLKVHSKKSSRRATQRVFDKRRREVANCADELQASKLSKATKAIVDGLQVAYKIEKLNGVVGRGKESTILHATGRDHEDKPGQEIAIKVFRTDQNVAFKTRDTYNKSKCPSYKFDKYKSKNDSLNKWAERGFKNLRALRRANINCPEAISLKRHVLVMTFLGSNARPAPQLKDAKLDSEQLQASFEQTIDIMKRMYADCDLIHGDLSEYNLLWYDERVYVIDVSQSMFTSHPNANAFLYRDCTNVLDFYRRNGLHDIMDNKTLFTMISGKDLSDKDVEAWTKIEDFPKNEKLMQQDEVADEKYNQADRVQQVLNVTPSSTRCQAGPSMQPNCSKSTSKQIESH